MEFTESYFEDEVREGFYVPGMMKRAWAAQLEVFEAVKKVCERHQIQYFAEWGTMLGAVRHGGMIPWDDDLDICMKRKDYEKFLEIAADELPEGYWIMNYRTSNTDNMVSKIVNYPISLLQEKDLPRFHGYPYTACIDLFALDFLPRDPESQKALWELIKLVGELNYHVDKGDMDTAEIAYALHGVERICGISFDESKPLKRQLVRALEEVAARFEERDSDELTAISIYLENQSYRIPKSYYEESVEMPFENTKIRVPAEYDKLLKRKYGDYMKPVRAWDSHGYPAYKNVHETIKDQMKIEPFQYHFSKEEMEEVNKKRMPKIALKKQVQDFLPLFSEAHDEIRRKIENLQWDAAAGILGECQEVAIQIGNMVEEKLGQGNAMIGVFEQYCETVFQFFEKLTGDEDVFQEEISQFCENLSDYEQQFANCAEHDLEEKKEVVFVPYKSSYWGAMDSVWQEAMEDEGVEVYVIPAPYYYKDDLGKVKSGEPHYETDYPEYVTITSYEEYNFETHHPDVVVTQYPYDEYSYALTIHPFFYSTNLKKYTDQLVYIPPFVMDEIGPEDERGRVTLRYFCNMPGVVHADTVIVQSEQMKDVYVELLTEFAGEDTREIWENKILGLGLQVYEYEKKIGKDNIDIPDEWNSVLRKADGSWKKIFLYSTSASTLLQHGEQMIGKMKTVFELFQKNQEEIALIWRPDSKARDMLRRKHSVLWQRYRDLVQEYKESHIGIYDDSPERDRAVLLCDAGYGDGGDTLNACRANKKPVMIQNVLC